MKKEKLVGVKMTFDMYIRLKSFVEEDEDYESIQDIIREAMETLIKCRV